jgi:hypothetical protein
MSNCEDIVKALREVKQRVFNQAVEGNPEQPAEVVDTVVYAIQDCLPDEVKAQMWPQVLNFYPDYEPTEE